MGHAMMNAFAVLLACLAAASAIPAHFPRGKVLVYKYAADVKAGIIEPAPYASQFGLEAVLKVQQDVSDPTLKNAYVVTLSDVKYGLHNGQAVHHEYVQIVHPLVEGAKAIQEPFLIVYDENGKFQGVKLIENESGWSKNIKQAIASMLQLDLSNIHVETPMKPHGFITHENTIHGTCQVAYDIHAKDQVHPETSNVFVVTKLHDPKNCSHFVQRVFDHVEPECCHVEQQDDMSTASRRVFEIENQGEEILIKKLIGHGVINYFPWLARSEAHYILNNQTLLLDNVVPVTEDAPLPVSFQNVPLVRDMTYNKPKENYAVHAAEDLTQGRHIVKLDLLIPKLKKMLAEAADYLGENHMDMKQPDWKHGQTINRLLHTMSYMDLGSLELVYNAIQDPKTPREVTIKNIFLDMVPHVGTHACCLFTRNVIVKHKVTLMTAIMMLQKLPLHVKMPSERLLLDMEELLKMDDSVSLEIRKASILCFATLVHKTFKHEQGQMINPLLERYLQRFINHVKTEPSYHMKMVYLMAIKNVGVGNIQKLLEPIIRGQVMISDKPYHIRVLAIWAVKKAVQDDLIYAHDLLWPVLADTSLPVTVRIAAYDVLIEQLPHMGRMMNLYWLMVYEKNEHLYNYHVTTIKNLANSVDPCMRPVSEMARKILRFTRDRKVPGVLSGKYQVGYTDPHYGYGETIKTSIVVNELTGSWQSGSVEYFTNIARKPVNEIGIHWHVTGVDSLTGIVKTLFFGKTAEHITNNFVQNILNKAARDMPAMKEVHIDYCLTRNGQVLAVQHYTKETWQKIVEDVIKLKHHLTKINKQSLTYHNLYEMQVSTDMGLPAVLATRMPVLMSLKLNTAINTEKPLVLKLNMDTRLWSHGEYVMSIYNPMVDVWHSIRRMTARDIVLPLELNLSYNHESQSLKVTLPRLPVGKFSIGGVSTFAKNYVTVTEDETDMLKKCCDTCLHHEIVTNQLTQKKNYHTTVDSIDTGLQYQFAIYDCENEVSPTTQMSEFLRILSDQDKNDMGNVIVKLLMAIRHFTTNNVILPQAGNCGTLIKVEPSVVHPTSQIDISARVNVEDLDHIHETMHMISSKKVNLRGIVDVKAASTNTSIRSWDVNVNADLSQGHTSNNLKIQITRITPGEKNMKVCVDSQVNYSEQNVQVEDTKDELNAKVTVAVGQTDEDKCVRDESMVTVTVKGDMLPEALKQAPQGIVQNCINEPAHWTSESLYFPHTLEQYKQTVLHTTARKYLVNVAYKKIPQSVLSTVVMIQDMLRHSALPHVRYNSAYTEPGNGKITMKYPVDSHFLDIGVITPANGYELVDLPVGHPIWNVLTHNLRFPITDLYTVLNGQQQICSVCPHTVVTFDNGTIPLHVSDEWVLVSGDYVHQRYAVFAKLQGSQVAVKVFVGEHELHIVPSDTNPVVVVDGNVGAHYSRGVMVPNDPNTYAIKMTQHHKHFVIQSQQVPMTVYCTPCRVTVMMHTELQGQITGLCGHMDGTHKEKLPKVYTTAQL